MIDTTQIIEYFLPQLAVMLPKLLYAIVTLLVGLRIVKIVIGVLDKTLKHEKVNPTLRPFLLSFTGTLLKILVVITVASMMGVEMTSFIALIGAAGLAVGLSLQGSLQNFAGGVLILAFKPFKVGDFIKAQGYSGKVKLIQIFSTTLTTPDNKTIIIPNGDLSNSSLINYSTEKTRRVDIVFGIDYEDDVEKAKKIIHKIVKEEKRILKDKDSFIKLTELGDSSLNITVKVWVKSVDYWDVYYDVLSKVKEEYDAAGISFPYPQMDVHLKKDA